MLQTFLATWTAIALAAAPGESCATGRIPLQDGWTLQSSVLVKEAGDAISTAGFNPEQWYAATVPSTVYCALRKRGVYPDVRIGLNSFKVPDASDTFNRKHDLARYSHLPGNRNPWTDPYWYRSVFRLPPLDADQRVWLNFNSINYRAEVWLNGRNVAGPRNMAGMFQRFCLDVTNEAVAGTNVLAVKVFQVDHVGEPDAQLEVFGRDRGFFKEIMKDMTEVMSIGYDCMATVPDRNMGICQEVWVETTGPVVIRDPFIVADLPLPKKDQATLGISAELRNGSARAVGGVL
ncbi:MAG: sugar-binding domain-containing protein, partial [Thermoguttaceae bacterium]